VVDSIVRVGVIGAGVMGTDHAQLLHGFVSGATVTTVADIDSRRASELAASLAGVRVSTDALALIADPLVDAVVIASHDTTHAELTLAAVEAGKPVLCEKPLAPTIEECLEIVRRDHDRVRAGKTALVSVGFMRRFDPSYVDLKALTASGELGTPLLMHCASRGVTSGPGATSEFSITGSAIHELDIVPWLLDSPIVEVSWHAPRSTALAPALQDPQVMLLRTADGVLTTVETFLNARYGYDIACEIVGETAAAAMNNPATTVVDAAGRTGSAYPADWRPRFRDAYRLELQAWITALRTGAPSPLASALDGLTATAVAMAAIQSMNSSGATVAVTLPELV